MRLEQAESVLRCNPPPVALVLGHQVQPLWDMAQHLVAHLSVLDRTFIWRLNADLAREVVVTAILSPSGASEHRYYVINLDGAAEQAQTILLKVLEEPPPWARFILVASKRPLATVMSRASVMKVGLQTREGPDRQQEWEAARPAVAAALKAAMSGDQALLEGALRHWEPIHTLQLGMWAAEAATGRWQNFEPSFAPEATMEHARRVLALLSRFHGARTSAAVALSSLQEGV